MGFTLWYARVYKGILINLMGYELDMHGEILMGYEWDVHMEKKQ